MRRPPPSERELTTEFAQALERLRRERGFTQAQLAEEAGLATEAYGRLERGVSLPRAPTLVALARALEVGTDALLMPAATADSSALKRASALPNAELARVIRDLKRLDPEALRAVAGVTRELARRQK